MINYYLITKPGIILGNLITVAAGFALAAQGNIDVLLFLATLFGLAFIIASGCVFNNYIDRNIGKKMERTKNRALASGKIDSSKAIFFGIFLGILGNVILFLYTNVLTACIADIGFLVYVLVYSIWKSRTIYATAIGSISGAIPPVVGYCAVSNQFDMGALILFMIMVLWQMPHFYSIAVYRFDDYKAASLPVLPVIKGMLRTKIQMIAYIIAFIGSLITLTLFGYTGYAYMIIAIISGALWLTLGIKGFTAKDDNLWARRMFRLSLVVVTAISVMIPVDVNLKFKIQNPIKFKIQNSKFKTERSFAKKVPFTQVTQNEF